MGGLCWGILLLLLLASGAQARRFAEENPIRMPTDGAKESAKEKDFDNIKGTRWAVLVAGSSGFGNYRHQSDVCHAYQLLRRNGLKEENIVVMMYDDIAHHSDNPRKGTIINHPFGSDVYDGVPKDYVGDAVNVENFYAVLLGNKNGTTGGSGKVIDSGPEDHVFVFYSDHGGPGVLGMPGYPYLYANDLINVLKKKHDMNGYKEMVIYLEACESGSIFEGMLPEGLNIYVTTASNAIENSWGTYCPGMVPAAPQEFGTCLGDLYSVSWMEDSEAHNLKKETLLQQYVTVKNRTSNNNTYQAGSHVMQYGDVKLNEEELAWFIGFDPDNVNLPNGQLKVSFSNSVDQRDADLLHLWHKYSKAREGTPEKKHARRRMMNALARRNHLDNSVELVSRRLFGSEAATVMKKARASGMPLVDDWQCLKQMVRVFESKCGSLGQYGMKHMRAFANMCNEGLEPETLESAADDVCSGLKNPEVWEPVLEGFSA